MKNSALHIYIRLTGGLLLAMALTNLVRVAEGGAALRVGNLTDALHIPPQAADIAMKIILAYLFVGSYATLFWLWRQKRKTPQSTPAVETTV